MLTYTIGAESGYSKIQKSYLHNAMAETFGHSWDVTPVGSSDFHMVIKSVTFGQMSLSQATVSQAKVSNLARLSHDSEDHAYNIFISNRRQKLETKGRTVILEPGDVTVTDSASPVTMTTLEPYTTTGLTVPASFLRSRIEDPEKVVCVRFSGKMGFSKIISSLLLTMWEYAESKEFESIASELAENLLGILSTCSNVNVQYPDEWNTDTMAKREMIKQLINQNLHNPDLSVGELARQFGFSIRYIQRLFSEEDYTISQYIRSQRLDGCKKQLTDPAWRNHSITEIAFNWGFNSSAHFARVFKEQYGISARDYRKNHLGCNDQVALET